MVPLQDWPANPELGAWVKRQRVARAAGQLSDDRMAILQGLGFEFGEVAQVRGVAGCCARLPCGKQQPGGLPGEAAVVVDVQSSSSTRAAAAALL